MPDTNNFRCFDFINTNKVLQYKSLAGIIFGKYANTFSLIYISIIALFVIIFLLFTPQVFVLGKLDKISYFIISTICVILEENVLIILLKQSIYTENFFHLLLFIFGLTLFLFVYISIYIYRLGKEKEKMTDLFRVLQLIKWKLDKMRK